MNKSFLDGLTPDFGDYSLDSVLDQYRTPSGETPSAETAEDIASHSRRIAMDTLGDTLRKYQQSHPHSSPENKPQEAKAPVAEAVSPKNDTTPKSVPDAPIIPDEDTLVSALRARTTPSKPRKKPSVVVGEDGIITLQYEDEAEQSEPLEQPQEEEKSPSEPEETPTGDIHPEPDEEPPLRARRSRSQKADGASGEKGLGPIVRLIAKKLVKKQLQTKEAANWPDPVEIRQTPELPPGKAAKFYTAQAKPIRLRCRISAFLCVILAWISLQLPMAGMLGYSVRLQAGASLVLSLAVMIAALDVVATGLRQLFSLHPGSEAITAAACALSCIDAFLVLLGFGETLPFCAVGAVALTIALWGERLTCTALRRTFKTTVSTKSPSVLTVKPDIDHGADGLLRSPRGTEGIVRRSEGQDMCQSAYAVAAPFLFGAALILSIVASLGGKGGYFLHTFSALLSVSASFSAFISFPLPFAMIARRLRNAGVAVSGYAGCAGIGKTKRIVISDEDLFPPGTIKFTGINVLEGAFVSKVVSYTASLLKVSGCGCAGVFDELITRRGYSLVDITDYKCHEGGGLSAEIGGESVLVGSTGFMTLMGIHLPQNMDTRNAICTAIMGELVGVFTLEYIPISSVQEALVSLFRGRTQAVFAIRDFNITPRMIRQLFRVPTDNFNFPAFRDRYRIAGSAANAGDAVDAVITRSGMMPMVEASEYGRKLYTTTRIGTILSLAGTIIGILIMFLLCRTGSFDTATVGNVLSFMLLWTLPVVILSIGQSR